MLNIGVDLPKNVSIGCDHGAVRSEDPLSDQVHRDRDSRHDSTVNSSGIEELIRKFGLEAEVYIASQYRVTIPLVAHVDMRRDTRPARKRDERAHARGTGTEEIQFVTRGQPHIDPSGHAVALSSPHRPLDP